MEDFRRKIIAEDIELNEKIIRLKRFIKSNKFEEIDKRQKSLLKIQLAAMNTYKRCLEERILTV